MPTHTRGEARLRHGFPRSCARRASVRSIAAVLLALTAVTLAGCGSDGRQAGSTGTLTSNETAATTHATTPAAFPITIENCGETVTITEPPTRAITMNQGATEIMLALGLEDHMIGTAYLDDAVLPEFQEAYNSVPVLAEKYPSREVLLGKDPDFVYGSYVSAFGNEGAGDRGSLHGAGIATYLSPNDCRAEENTPITFDDVFDEIREIGKIFGVGDRAEKLIADSKAQLASAAEGVPKGLSVFWYDSGTDAPYTAGCCGAPAMIMNEVGVTNVFAELDGGWADGSWETVVAADPDLIVLVEASWDTVDSKIKTLARPPMASMTAVTKEHYATVPFSSTTPGVRNVNAVIDIAEAIKKKFGS
ncbi:MAG: ABC transporter substrate-binding protein [Acidimicrobiales bacterium]|nr:ABC transporter substrate-binding protein [Acidimicrobiales bacterium]